MPEVVETHGRASLRLSYYDNILTCNAAYNLALIAAVSFSKPGFSSNANIFFL